MNLDDYRPSMLRVAYRVLGDWDDAEDAVQIASLRAWRHSDKFDGRQPGPWLRAIARNAALGLMRARAARSKNLLPMFRALDEPSKGPSVECEAGARADLERLLALVEALPNRQRATLLAVADGDEYQEIADRLSVPKGTVQSRVFYARKALERAWAA